MKCPVCGFEIDIKTVKCPDCNFDEFKSEFLNHAEYETWMLNTVVPWRDAFVDKLLKQATSCNELVRKWTTEAEKEVNIGNKIPKSHFIKTNAIFELFDASINGIESMAIDWIIRSTTMINYIEHMGFLDYLDNIAYTFDFTKENVTIKYTRRTNNAFMHGIYDNVNIKSKDFLHELFEMRKIHMLEPTGKDEVFADDSAYWEMNIQLRYPLAEAFFDDTSDWKYSVRNRTTDVSKIEQWRWANIETDYMLECGGQFNEMHKKMILLTSLGKYIKEPPRNIEVIKYDETDMSDVW